ncbi:hypothetical protein BLAT2472_20103 [Burkholderia latens]|nr:hypothetical protein WK25_18355 [Burkholderia latens]
MPSRGVRIADRTDYSAARMPLTMDSAMQSIAKCSVDSSAHLRTGARGRVDRNAETQPSRF